MGVKRQEAVTQNYKVEHERFRLAAASATWAALDELRFNRNSQTRQTESISRPQCSILGSTVLLHEFRGRGGVSHPG